MFRAVHGPRGRLTTRSCEAGRTTIAPGALRARAPADGDLPGGRFVVHGRRVAWGPGGVTNATGGLARLLEAVIQQIPREEIDAVYAFPPVRREGREHGVAVVSRTAPGGRRRVYRARYVVALKGPERGKVAVEVEETAEGPPELVPQVIAGVGRRADEAGEAELIDLSTLTAGCSDERRVG